MTAPVIAALTTFQDDTPGASSQATGLVSRTSGRGYLVTVLVQNSITANPGAVTVTGTGITFTEIANHLPRSSGANRARQLVFWGIASSTSNTALTVSYPSGDTMTSLDVLVEEVTNFETSDPIVAVYTSGTQNLPANTTTSFVTLSAFAHVDNRSFSVIFINGADATLAWEANYTQLSTLSGATAPTRRQISAWRNSATPDLTPAVSFTPSGAWTAGQIAVEIRGAGTLPPSRRPTKVNRRPRGNLINANYY